VTKRFSDPKVTPLETAIDETLAAVFGHGTVEYDRYSPATVLDHGPVTTDVTPDWIGAREGHFGAFGHDEMGEARHYVSNGKQQAIGLLRQAVRGLEEEIELAGPASATLSEDARPTLSRKVFVVHGRDDAAKNEVALFLRTIGLEHIILHLRPNGGRHLLTKFREESRGLGLQSS
jgi:hypothetical protein